MFIECFSSSIFLFETKFYVIITLYDDRIAIKGGEGRGLGSNTGLVRAQAEEGTDL